MSDRIYAATRKGLFTIDRDNGGGWEICHADFLGDSVSIVYEDRRHHCLLTALDHGHFGAKLHRRVGDEQTWHECAVPEYPTQPEGETELDAFGREYPWKLVKIWALTAGGQPSDVWWCGTIPGGLFRSEDRGSSWQIVRSLWDHPDRKQWFGGGADLPGIHSICVDPRDSNQVRVGVSCGGVWVTQDGGTTWNCQADGMYATFMPPERKFDLRIQDAHLLVQCRAAPNCYWVQHHNGIFRSTDNCASWQDVKEAGPSTFGFAVAVHPDDPNTAWFVPGISDECRIPADGSVVVTRTRDGGRSFDVLADGLPQQHAYDIVFRHALAVDDNGSTLAMGSSMGALWVSEDQGDHWTCVSEHLPPVYCVQFSSRSD